jgi:hypothetical protein
VETLSFRIISLSVRNPTRKLVRINAAISLSQLTIGTEAQFMYNSFMEGIRKRGANSSKRVKEISRIFK